ncbi:MAG TPA: SufD family Fe-S cluster assembly protein [Rhodocyclaceae bacterium]|nr:SufD family Fe-S cluster assembly protein [Rhodocyclaceae bacterium]
MSELDKLLAALDSRGVDRAILADAQTAHVMASGHRLLSRRQVPGVNIAAEESDDGISADIRVACGTYVAHPLHLCFGVLPPTGRQYVHMRLTLEDDAALDVVAHCFFPNAERVEHLMDAVIEVGAGARLTYAEGHYHGPYGGVTVVPKAVVKVGKHGLYRSDFSLITGRVGKLDIDYEVALDEDATAELTARVFGHGTDTIHIRERLMLDGHAARGLIKTRVALEHDATADVIGITEGNAARARGHVDCMEIVKDRAVASAQPLVKVTHPEAKVTHEAAIGSVDHHQLETLMAHGLSPEQAVDLIVGGLLGTGGQGGRSVVQLDSGR